MDPNLGGGTLAVMRTLYSLVEKWGTEPHLLYTSATRGVERRDILNLDFSKWKASETYEYGMRCVSSGYFLPGLLLTLRDFFLFFRIKHYLKDASIFLCAGGTNHSALPFVLSQKRFVCWISTVFSDEILAQRDGRGGWRRRRDKYFYHLALYLEKMIFRKAALILVHSEYTMQRIKQLYPECSEKIRYVPVPIDVNLFRPGETKYASETESRLLFVGRINDPRKNATLLFRAFAQVKAAVPGARLTIIGDRPRADLVELCKQLGIISNVQFLEVPYDKGLAAYYGQADIFVLPSLQEGLGIVMLEALACGVPVVATRCGGAESIIQNGVNGYLVENNNCDALSKATVSLLCNEALRKNMGKRGMEIVRNRFSIETVEENLYRHLSDVFPELSEVSEQK